MALDPAFADAHSPLSPGNATARPSAMAEVVEPAEDAADPADDSMMLGDGDESVAPFDDADLNGSHSPSGALSPSAYADLAGGSHDANSGEADSFGAMLRRARAKLAAIGALTPGSKSPATNPIDDASPEPAHPLYSNVGPRPTAPAGGSSRRRGTVGFVPALAAAAEDDDDDGLDGDGETAALFRHLDKDDGTGGDDWDVIPIDLDEAAANATFEDGFGTGTADGGGGLGAVSLGDGFLSKLMHKRASVTLLDGGPLDDPEHGGDTPPRSAASRRQSTFDTSPASRQGTFFRARRRSFHSDGGGGSNHGGSFTRRGSRRVSVGAGSVVSSRRSSVNSMVGGSSEDRNDGDDDPNDARSFVNLMATARRQGVEIAEERGRELLAVAASVDLEHFASRLTSVVAPEQEAWSHVMHEADGTLHSTAEYIRCQLERRREPAARAVVVEAETHEHALLQCSTVTEGLARTEVAQFESDERLPLLLELIDKLEETHRRALDASCENTANVIGMALGALHQAARDAAAVAVSTENDEADARRVASREEAATRDLLRTECLDEPASRDTVATEERSSTQAIARESVTDEEQAGRRAVEGAAFDASRGLLTTSDALQSASHALARAIEDITCDEATTRHAMSDEFAQSLLACVAANAGSPRRHALVAEALDAAHGVERAELAARVELLAHSAIVTVEGQQRLEAVEEAMSRAAIAAAMDAERLRLFADECEGCEAVARHELRTELKAIFRSCARHAKALRAQAALEASRQDAADGLAFLQGHAEPSGRADIVAAEHDARRDVDESVRREHAALLRACVADALAVVEFQEQGHRASITRDENAAFDRTLAGPAQVCRSAHLLARHVVDTAEVGARPLVASAEQWARRVLRDRCQLQTAQFVRRAELVHATADDARRVSAHGAGLALLATLAPDDLRRLLREFAKLEKREGTSRRHIGNEAEAERDALEQRIAKRLKKHRRASNAAPLVSSVSEEEEGTSSAEQPTRTPPPRPAPPSTGQPSGRRGGRPTNVMFTSLSISAMEDAHEHTSMTAEPPAGDNRRPSAASPQSQSRVGGRPPAAPASPRTRQSPLATKAPSTLRNKWDRVLRDLAAVDDAFDKSGDGSPIDIGSLARSRRRRRSSTAATGGGRSDHRLSATASSITGDARRRSTSGAQRRESTAAAASLDDSSANSQRRRSSVAPPGSAPGQSRSNLQASSAATAALSPRTGPNPPSSARRKSRKSTTGDDGLTFAKMSDDLRMYGLAPPQAPAPAPSAAGGASPQPAPPATVSPGRGGASIRLAVS